MRKKYIALFAVALAMIASLGATRAADQSGVHGFDFEFGNWRVHHRVKRASGEWLEFDGTCTANALMGGAGNVEEHTFNKPDGVTYGVALRAYDAKTGKWAIWWLDGRVPHGPLDPPTVGKFDNGVGMFYWEGIFNGKQVRTRAAWSQITPTSAHWEQANSYDDGKTWEPNWIMEFRRTDDNRAGA